MIGTLFLWCYWPSFNSALALNETYIFLSYLNTYFCLIGSLLGTIGFCVWYYEGKYNMD